MRQLAALLAIGGCLLAEQPQYRYIPAAATSELTPAIAVEANAKDWMRSHGDHASSRYSSLKQINRGNVSRLRVAWTYRSGDGKSNIQANPVIVNGVLYAPTAGQHMVAVDAATGREIWRYKPQGRPAFRGLVYWPGDATHQARIYFTSGDWLYSLDAATGKPPEGFGSGGRVVARGTVAPALYQNILVVPCWNQVRAFDLLTGAERWTFNNIPGPGEFGSDTWSGPGYGANTWGGMALDQVRGIAYVSTGSPHPNYLGMNYAGANLFANCVIALDAKTGRRLWHFQEIRHDVWDLDIPAPPNLGYGDARRPPLRRSGTGDQTGQCAAARSGQW